MYININSYALGAKIILKMYGRVKNKKNICITTFKNVKSFSPAQYYRILFISTLLQSNPDGKIHSY